MLILSVALPSFASLLQVNKRPEGEHLCRNNIPGISPEFTLFLKSWLEYVDSCGIPQHLAYLVFMTRIKRTCDDADAYRETKSGEVASRHLLQAIVFQTVTVNRQCLVVIEMLHKVAASSIFDTCTAAGTISQIVPGLQGSVHILSTTTQRGQFLKIIT